MQVLQRCFCVGYNCKVMDHTSDIHSRFNEYIDNLNINYVIIV